MPSEPGFRQPAAAWAERLGLPLLEPRGAGGSEPAGAAGARLRLEVGGWGLRLRPEDGPAVTVEPRALAQRRRGRDLLLRAVGRLEAGASVVDATAGLGADAFHLAARGLRVVMLERQPLAACLLEDALGRARRGSEGEAARIAAGRLALRWGDARSLLPELDPAPAVIVLDPMYPEAAKGSLPKKGMALFRRWVGGDPDADTLLAAALATARRRVVVKRPRRAPALGEGAGLPAPTGSVVGTTVRYDLYAPATVAS